MARNGRVVAACAVAAVLTWLVVSESFRAGRLLGVPRVDDVLYLARGAEFVEAWRGGGVVGVVGDWLAHPPHSPYVAGIAFLAFVIFGVREWGPYVLAGVPVAWFVWLAARLSVRRSVVMGAGVMVCLVCVPMFPASIHNLKPDYVAGMLGAAGVGIAAVFGRVRMRSAACAGVCFGLAVWAKPTMAPLPGVVALATAACIVGLPVRNSRERRVQAMWRALVMLAVASTIVGVLALIDGARVFGYVRETLVGESSERWHATDSVWQRVVYHVRGPGGRLMLGEQVWALAGLVIAAIGVAWVRGLRWVGGMGGRRSERIVLLSMGLPLLTALAVVSAVPMRIAQFGACFQTGLALMAMVGLGYVARRMRVATGRRWMGAAVVWGVAAVMLLNARWTFPRAMGPEQRMLVAEKRAVAERVYAAAMGASREGMDGGCAIVIGGDPGDVCAELLRLWSVRDGVRMRFGRVVDVDAAQVTPDALGAPGDMLIISDGGAGMTAQKRGVKGANERILAAVELLPGWRVVARIPGPRGQGVFVVARRDAE